MASKKIGGKSGGGDSSILAKIVNSDIVSQGRSVACDAVYVSKKLLKSTGKAAWIAGTTFLILIVPLIIEMDREQQFSELELQQASLLGAPPSAGAQK
ncbi:PREDICTED: mitochondrial import receptor subunit TOM9-2-like [Tarenaya hassleriana]|uniref:mitochondrial import receptor subunit TOM9-2-like n=1 Tax=Tarenaya hassleriana TaxID=28532 RepID=UPI00053C19FE|nr:PREDICTED: mitochondrial import receptor subunit TOM9-2-like [Tarenaya hassleriana]